MMEYHTTVLLHQGVEALDVDPKGVYVDVTFGGGGHSNVLLQELGDRGRLLAFDQDQDVIPRILQDSRFQLFEANFRFIKNFLKVAGVDKVDGLIADLGVSGHHFDSSDRGFSFRFKSDLDMRMNRNQSLDAKQVVNEYELDDLIRIFRRYGETSFALKIARRILKARSEGVVATTDDLSKVVESCVPQHKFKSELTKIFQAIRIEVNDELGALEELLVALPDVVRTGGRVVIISYHSLEDRLVKHFFRSGNLDDNQEKDLYGNVLRSFNPLGKVVKPTPEEIEQNPRARSAKMRIAQKS